LERAALEARWPARNISHVNVKSAGRGRRAVPATAVVLAALWAGPLTAAAAAPQTFTVTRFDDPTPAACQDTVCPSLRDAVSAANANPGSTIELQAGTFTLAERLRIAPPATISGAGPGGPAGTTIEQTHDDGVDESQFGSGTLALDGVEIEGGQADGEGGGIGQFLPGVTLSLDNDLITGNTVAAPAGSPDGSAVEGGGIFSAGPLQLTDTDVSDNHADGGGGQNFFGSPNDGTGGDGGAAQGGGIYAEGATTITGGSFSGNNATGGAGGGSHGSTADGGNGGLGAGGAIFVPAGGQLTVTSATFSANNAIGGAGGSPAGSGNWGANAAGEGGAINALGTLTVTGSQLTNNQAAGADTAPIAIPGANATKTAGTGEGGGINASGATAISDSTISGNDATGGRGGFEQPPTTTGGPGGIGEGGGIFTSSVFDFTMRSSTVAGNSAIGGVSTSFFAGDSPGPDGAAAGGGLFQLSGTVFIAGEKTAVVINSTVGGNSASSAFSAFGGGLAGQGALGVRLASDTVAGNTAPLADSLYSVPGTLKTTFTLQDTILAANPSGGAVECDAQVSDSGHNLEDSGATSACGLSAANGDVLVAPGASGVASALASNGGATQTLALSGSSPAIGAGGPWTDPANSDAPLTVDQRDLPRPATCDIGAFEHQAPANTARPAITGTPAVGDTLTCDPGTFTGDGVSVGFVWLRDGSSIASATSATYTVEDIDAGHAIACKVTATGTHGSDSATSATISIAAQVGTPTVRRQTDTVSAQGATKVKVGCRGPGLCAGTLKLTATVTTRRHHTTHHRQVVIAKVDFAILTDRVTAVTVHLNGIGRRLLSAASGKLHLTITVSSSEKRLTASAQGTLRLVPKRRRKHHG
jgi:hypothetical protein